MTELSEIKARRDAVIKHFEYWSELFSEQGHSINARCCQRQAELIRYVVDGDEKTWKKELFEGGLAKKEE